MQLTSKQSPMRVLLMQITVTLYEVSLLYKVLLLYCLPSRVYVAADPIFIPAMKA